MLRIGLSACFMYPDPKREVFGPKSLLYMGHDMSHYFGLRGVLPILIPDFPCRDLMSSLMDQLDGLVLQGGRDINPELYGETPLNFRMEGDPQRDMYEIQLIELARERGLPIFGICRGAQLLNVFFGGTLYQDIASQRADAKLHHDHELYDNLIHEVEFIPGGDFARIYAQEQCFTVNSVHHQAVKKLGKGLRIEAISPEDQIIEGFSLKEKSGPPDIFGVQWHPEFFHSADYKTLSCRPLVDYFLERAKVYRKKFKNP